jgi:hypothetical protein
VTQIGSWASNRRSRWAARLNSTSRTEGLLFIKQALREMSTPTAGKRGHQSALQSGSKMPATAIRRGREQLELCVTHEGGEAGERDVATVRGE